MNWTDLLKAEIDDKFKATEGLLELVDDSMLGWKPATGENWMTMGQLLWHLPEACGFCMRGFVTKEWDMPEGEPPPEGMLPPAAVSAAAV